MDRRGLLRSSIAAVRGILGVRPNGPDSAGRAVVSAFATDPRPAFLKVWTPGWLMADEAADIRAGLRRLWEEAGEVPPIVVFANSHVDVVPVYGYREADNTRG